jgi:4-diphosphocytidyl-2-C-methyl-D-erythritol kinase
MTVTEKAYAKINLTLEVLDKRADGYHNIESIMTTVNLYDTVTITAHTGGECRLTCDTAVTEKAEDNLCMKALRAFFAHTGLACDGVDIALEKRIPMQAGLGGGSADAAAVLRGLQKIYAPDMERSELETIAATVGSDVPFCVGGGTQLVCGRGEELSPLPPVPPCTFLIVKPRESFSTAEMYARLDMCEPEERTNCREIAEVALKVKEVVTLAVGLHNDFEKVLPLNSQVPMIHETMLRRGAWGTVLCGSGSAVAGLYRTEEETKETIEVLKISGWDYFMTEPV